EAKRDGRSLPRLQPPSQSSLDRRTLVARVRRGMTCYKTKAACSAPSVSQQDLAQPPGEGSLTQRPPTVLKGSCAGYYNPNGCLICKFFAGTEYRPQLNNFLTGCVRGRPSICPPAGSTDAGHSVAIGYSPRGPVGVQSSSFGLL